MKQKNWRKRSKKRLRKDIQAVHQEFVDDGLIEELPGGFIRVTPKGEIEFDRMRKTEQHQEFMRLTDEMRQVNDQNRDLMIKGIILQTTRQIVSASV